MIVVIDIAGDDKNIPVLIEVVSVSDIVRTIYAQFPDTKGVNHERIFVRAMSANYVSYYVIIIKKIRLVMLGIFGDRVENGTKRRLVEVEHIGKTPMALTNGNARNFKIFTSHTLGDGLHSFAVNLETFKHSVTSNHLEFQDFGRSVENPTGFFARSVSAQAAIQGVQNPSSINDATHDIGGCKRHLEPHMEHLHAKSF